MKGDWNWIDSFYLAVIVLSSVAIGCLFTLLVEASK